jgi:transglutaminase-like putative cysteine protease
MESSRMVKARWELSDTDLYRVADLSWALVAGAGLLTYSMGDHLLFLFRLVEWMPFCFFPLMLAQAYGNRASMPLSVFWCLLRRSPQTPAARRTYNFSFCYFAICILAASTATQPNAYLYPGVTVLVAIALTTTRPRRISAIAWVALLLVTAIAGQISHQALRQMQDSMERALGQWIVDLFRPPSDMKELQTRIEYPGPIPQSGRIVLRLRGEPGSFVPALLREATWDEYRRGIWKATNSDFSVVRLTGEDTINLLPTNALCSDVEIARYFDGGSGVLPLPQGTSIIQNIPVDVSTNRLGAVRIDDGPSFLDMTATFYPGKSLDSAPDSLDLLVPDEEQPAFSNVVAQLKMAHMTERQRIRAVAHFFANNFTYTLNPPRHHDPLTFFLTNSHAGHCEYFATATVLLLRQAGVRARYATGYAVHETERHGDTYLVRGRDAHAWALVYYSDTGLWEPLDTTPGDWEAAQANSLPVWQPLSDALSNLYFQFSKWRWSKTSYARYSMWLMLPLILYLVVRILFARRRQRRQSGADDASDQLPWPGIDSELYLIERRLAEAQLSRLPNEPLYAWQQRLEVAFPGSVRLRRIFHLHRCLRFDPRGLPVTDRDMLRSEAMHWLAEFNARQAERKPMPADRIEALR